MNINLARKTSVVIITIIVLGAVWFFPREYWTCNGSFECYGCIFHNNKELTMLNARTSFLEIEKDPTKICLGYTRQVVRRADGCNGSTGWFNKRPVDCREMLQRCQAGDPMPFGIECKEWQRACDALSSTGSVKIKIRDYQKTGIAVSCNYRPAAFPGGETDFVKFLNNNFRYPDSLKAKRVDGMLHVIFSIDTLGLLKEVFFREPLLHEYYSAEARRVLRMMPVWSPEFCDQRKVESAENYLFHFSNTDSTFKHIQIKVSKP
jgi:hypothetical protein